MGRRQQLQRKRRTEVPPLPPPKKWKREPETVPEEGATSATEVVDSDSLCMESIACCTCFTRVKKKFYPSVVVNQLMGLGIAPLATEFSLVPRPSPAPVFDRLQYAKTEPEGLVNLTT